MTEPEATPAGAGRGPGRPGARIFTIEGRAAPGLYLVGWLGTLIGLGLLLVAALAGGGTAAGVLLVAGLVVLAAALVAAAGSQALERRARRHAGYAGPSPWLVFAASLPLTILAVLAVLLPSGGAGSPITPLTTLVSVLATAVVYVLLVRLVVVGTGALSWSDMGFGWRGRAILEDLAWGATVALPVVLVTLVAAAVLVTVFGATPDSPLPPSSDTTGLLMNLIAAAIAAPIGEEVFFRGFATTAWARTSGPRAAIVRGAIFFALVHVLTIGGTDFSDAWRRAAVAFASRLPVALALGWVFLSRRSIYASIGLHATFNAVVLVLAELGASIGE